MGGDNGSAMESSLPLTLYRHLVAFIRNYPEDISDIFSFYFRAYCHNFNLLQSGYYPNQRYLGLFSYPGHTPYTKLNYQDFEPKNIASLELVAEVRSVKTKIVEKRFVQHSFAVPDAMRNESCEKMNKKSWILETAKKGHSLLHAEKPIIYIFYARSLLYSFFIWKLLSRDYRLFSFAPDNVLNIYSVDTFAVYQNYTFMGRGWLVDLVNFHWIHWFLPFPNYRFMEIVYFSAS